MLLAARFYEDPLALFLIGMSLLVMFFWYFATELERRKRNLGTVLVIGVTALCILAMSPPKERLKGGIDIVGGSSFTLRVQQKEDDNGNLTEVSVRQVDQAIKVISSRLDSMGTAEAQISRLGQDSIVVQMPGISPEESAKIKATLEKVAKLELREVSPRNDERVNGKPFAQVVKDNEQRDPGYVVYDMVDKDADGNEVRTPILLRRRAALGGNDVSFAYPSQMNNDAVDIELTSAGGDKMIALTQNMREGQDRIAIVLDGEVISAPVVQKVPLGRNFQISGLRDPGERESLANALMNPLENPLKIDNFSAVSPTLGMSFVKQALWAAVAGLTVTFLFVLIYYRVAGFVALIGLILNGVILFGVMAMFSFTFSLPGIAGIILTIGMAVDANVLIYERLREEMEAGKSFRNAIEAAYEKAFSAIFDANITSLITAVILFFMASGAVKGFAVTLTVGIISSMFSAILVTRVFFRWGVDFGILKKLSFLNLIRSKNVDFLGRRKQAAVFSGILLIVTIFGPIFFIKNALGVDFTGGTSITFQLGNEEVAMQEINDVIEGLDLIRSASAQKEFNVATGTSLIVRCDTADAGKIITSLRASIPVLGTKLAEPTNVPEASEDANATEEVVNRIDDPGPGMDWKIDASREEVSAYIGKTFLREALIALGLGMVGILIYVTIRFEFSFAMGGFLAIVHDVIITLGIVMLMGREISLIHVGAILAVAGYSINDTIVVFDRIRETLFLRSGGTEEIMNEALNATLSRTILTSATTIATVVILAVLGGTVLRDFSITILVGLIVGTYSSIFVASPAVLWLSSRKGSTLRGLVQREHLGSGANEMQREQEVQ